MSEVTLTSAMRNNLAQLRLTSMLMETTQNRIATGNKVNSALDDPTAFFKAKGLKDDANDLNVLKDNMGQTISSIQAADKAITSITELVEQAKSLANSAKAESDPTERAALAAQFDEIRAQIDTLSADASYGGQNLVSGRGVITGGTFLDTTSTAITSLNGVTALARSGTDTNIGTYSVTVEEKLNALNTVKIGSVTQGAGGVGPAAAGSTTAADSLEFFIDGVSVGIAALAATATTGTVYAAVIDALSSDLTSAIDTDSKLSLTVAEGKTLEIRSVVDAIGNDGLLTDLGLSEGLQNDTTGAQVVDLTSDLGIRGAEVYAHISGYTASSTVTDDITFSLSGTTLTVTEVSTGSTATIDTGDFSAAGTDTLGVGSMTVNFVTSTAAENTNAAPAVTGTVASDFQVGTVLFTIGETMSVNDQFTFVVNGTSYAWTLTTATTTTTKAVNAFMASSVKTSIEADHNIAITQFANDLGLTFTSDLEGDDFTLAATQTALQGATEVAPTVNATTVANAVQTATVDIAGVVDDGDTYTVTISNATTATTQTITYTATASDTTITNIATGLTTAINANTTLVGGAGWIQTATSSAGQITLQENKAGIVLTFGASSADASISFGNESGTTSTQTLKSLTAGGATGDARVKVTSGGVTETVNIDNSDTAIVTASNAAWGSSITFTAKDQDMVAGDSADITVTNPTGTGANDASVVFNTDGTSTINVQAVDTTSSGLSISAAASDWAANTNVDAALTELDAAKLALRSNSKTMATSLGVIQTRETFTENFIDNLRVGSDKLTLADGTEEATNMLMLQTRQQLGIQALSMASQSSQSILSLFR